MYYLQSRYYNPEWGRFINADGILGQTGELLGHNLFAYCKNNPVNRQDPSGFLSFNASDGFGDCDPPTVNTTYNSVVTSATMNGVAAATDNTVNSASSLSANQINKVGKALGWNRSTRRNFTRNIPSYARDLKVPMTSGWQSVGGWVSTALFTLVAVEDWRSNDSFGSKSLSIGIDAVGVLAGVGAGFVIGAGAAALAPLAIPGVVITGLAVGATYGTGYAIGKGTSLLKQAVGVR